MEAIVDKQVEKKDYIDLDRKKIGDEGLAYLCSQDIQGAWELSIRKNNITAKGMASFPKANWQNLLELDMCQNFIGNKGCKYLSRANINNIEKLHLDVNEIGREGAAHLSKAPFKRLDELTLMANKTILGTYWWLIRSNWKSMKKFVTGVQFESRTSRISFEEGLSLMLCQFKYIRSLLLRNYDNEIKFGEVLNSKFGQNIIKLC